ncbi:MAG: hypothetical protein ACTSU2_05005 [Promethearchaeota archaeon]
METPFHDLGVAVLKLSRYIRKHGFGAQAIHPLGGSVMLVPLALNANIGWVGHQGLIISPEFGPRMRLGAVLTYIENLPFKSLEDNQHSWINDFCKDCNVCVRSCHGSAIHKETIEGENGHRHYIDINKCFPHFTEEYGCTICIKVCPFSRIGYYRVKMQFERKREKNLKMARVSSRQIVNLFRIVVKLRLNSLFPIMPHQINPPHYQNIIFE